MNKLIEFFNKKYGDKYGKTSYPRTTLQIYRVYQTIKSYGIEDEELTELLHKVELPKPRNTEEWELYVDCLYNIDDSELERKFKDAPKGTSIEEGKIYLLKENGDKIDEGTELPSIEEQVGENKTIQIFTDLATTEVSFSDDKTIVESLDTLIDTVDLKINQVFRGQSYAKDNPISGNCEIQIEILKTEMNNGTKDYVCQITLTSVTDAPYKWIMLTRRTAGATSSRVCIPLTPMITDVNKEYVDNSLKNKVDKVEGKGLSTVDFTTAYETKLKKLENYNDTIIKNDIEDINTQLEDIANKSLTIEQKKALNNMFKVCAYISDDISSEYDAFKTAFGIETTNYTIANNLTNCTNNNFNTNIEEGENYKATLIANTGYVLSSVTVTMGDTDITSTAYSNGVITINNVTGNITITANAIVKTLTSISATYTGGNVNVGTELTSLTGITVTATYSDNTTSIVNGYTLSGTIAEGSNTITVTYQDKTTTFIVTGVVVSTDVSNETKWTNGVAYGLSPITGKYVDNTTGEIIDYSTYSITPYLYCKGASKIRIKVIYETTALNSGNQYNAFYDENKTFISSFIMIDSDRTVGAYKDIEVPSNASYFVLSHKSTIFSNTGNDNNPVIEVTPYN